MPPRVRLPTKQMRLIPTTPYVCIQCRHASLATTPAAPIEHAITAAPPISRYPPTQPPSHKPAEFRKSQLHRQYQSALRSSPLMLLFQHNNLRAAEWVSIRRELATALAKVDEDLAKSGIHEYIGSRLKLQIVQTGIFASALKVVEFWNPNFQPETPTSSPAAGSDSIADVKPAARNASLAHGLSTQAYSSARKNQKLKHGLEPLLSGPIALLTFPTVSPQHLKAALSILAPSPAFPAPKRRTNPSYHEPAVQSGLQKLMLLGARVEGKVFDQEGTKWVGGIAGGLDGLRAQLVAMLSGVGAGITNTLESAGRSLYVTVESRRIALEEEQKGPEGDAVVQKPE